MALYLGLDSSTQSLSALVIDTDAGCVLFEDSVSFGEDLPEYGCPQGVLPHGNPLVRHADPCLWAAALELLLQRLSTANVPLGDVRGISGSGQQHGTVYLGDPFPAHMEGIDSLAGAVAACLSRPTAPLWLDSSTTEECREIDAALGGGMEVRRRTGSAATERFSGPQIRRFAKTDPDGYRRTDTIHLVSSFMCSLLLGSKAPIDVGDGAGMNLLDLATGDWDDALLEATAADLRKKLPDVVPSATVVGALSPYFCDRFGFHSDTPVVAWSGDNPNSLIGVGGWQSGSAVISLGTSDTVFAAMSTPQVDPRGYGHVFGNPAGGFMCLICFKNGSLAREAVKTAHGLSWSQFDTEAFAHTPPGNRGNLMLPYFASEITPLVLQPGVIRQGSQSFIADQDPTTAVRAIVEAQAMSMKIHSEWIGASPTVIRVTGGASRSPGIRQVLADVFGARVERLEVGNSAALGSAMRAAQAVQGLSWNDLTTAFCDCDETQSVTPVAKRESVYASLRESYRQLEDGHLGVNGRV